jgi:hypothetical protein
MRTLCTLEVGEELVLEGGARVTVLAVEGDAVLLGVSTPEELPPAETATPEGRAVEVARPA